MCFPWRTTTTPDQTTDKTREYKVTFHGRGGRDKMMDRTCLASQKYANLNNIDSDTCPQLEHCLALIIYLTCRRIVVPELRIRRHCHSLVDPSSLPTIIITALLGANNFKHSSEFHFTRGALFLDTLANFSGQYPVLEIILSSLTRH